MLFHNWHLIRKHPVLITAMVLFAGLLQTGLVIINYEVLRTPLFLDTIATLISTAAFGMTAGSLTAVVTHLLLEINSGFSGDFLPWVIVNISSAAVLGILVKKQLFSTILHCFIAVLAITLVNSVLGAIIATAFYGGITGHRVDYIVTSFLAIGQSLTSASFFSRLPINIIDKGIAVIAAYMFNLFWFSRWETYAREIESGNSG